MLTLVYAYTMLPSRSRHALRPLAWGYQLELARLSRATALFTLAARFAALLYRVTSSLSRRRYN